MRITAFNHQNVAFIPGGLPQHGGEGADHKTV